MNIKFLKNWSESLKNIKEQHPKTYLFLTILYYLATFIIGILIGFFLSDKLMYFEHTGLLGFSSFKYNNIDNFRKIYYENESVSDQTLKVFNSWKNEIGANTQINLEPDAGGEIKITCKIDDKNGDCDDYEIAGGLHQVLYYEIYIYKPNLEEYKLCFTTSEGNNRWNNYKKCTTISIFPKTKNN